MGVRCVMGRAVIDGRAMINGSASSRCVVGAYGGPSALLYMDLDVHSGGGAEMSYEDIL